MMKGTDTKVKKISECSRCFIKRKKNKDKRQLLEVFLKKGFNIHRPLFFMISWEVSLQEKKKKENKYQQKLL